VIRPVSSQLAEFPRLASTPQVLTKMVVRLLTECYRQFVQAAEHSVCARNVAARRRCACLVSRWFSQSARLAASTHQSSLNFGGPSHG
jgi:hypothetical protein